MASQLQLEWVKQENGQYVPTNTISPFGDNFVKIKFKEGYSPTSDISQLLVNIVEQGGSSIRLDNFAFILGTGSNSSNTQTGYDDWGLAQEAGLFGYAGFSHGDVNPSPYYYNASAIYDGGKFVQIKPNTPNPMDTIPYGFKGYAGMSNHEVIVSGNTYQIQIPNSNAIEYSLDPDTNLVEYVILNLDNDVWGNLFVKGDEELGYLNLDLSTQDGFLSNTEQNPYYEQFSYVNTITGGTGWGNSPYPLIENDASILQIPQPILYGREIGVGFSISIHPTQNVLTGDFTTDYFSSSRINIQTGLRVGNSESMSLIPTISSYNFQDEVELEDIASGHIELSFGDFAGVFDRQDFDVDGNPDEEDQNLQSLLPTLDLIGFNYIDDCANYGVLDFDNPSLYGKQVQVGQGETINVNFSYTPVNTGQESFTIYVVYQQIDNSMPEYWVEFFNSLEEWGKWYIAKDCAINNVREIIPDADIDEEYSPPATGSDYDPSNVMIENPIDIMFHLSEQELGYNKPINSDKIDEARYNHNQWKLGFSVNETIEGKDLLSEISLASKSVPIFANDTFSFFNVKDTYRGGTQYYTDGTIEDIALIKEKDVLKYSFSRTPIDDIITKIDIKYNMDYGLGKHTDDFEKTSSDIYPYYLTRSFGELADFQYTYEDKFNYYGLKFNKNTLAIDHSDTTEVIESDYIRKEQTAQKSAEFLLGWKYNVHNKVNLTLPLKYYNLELGDLIEFDKMILNKKIYNESYVLEKKEDMPIRCGQYILPIFIVNNIKKSLKDVQIEATQLHHIGTQDLNWRGWNYPAVKDLLPPIIAGDVDGDGYISVLDVLILINMILDEEGGEVDYFNQADYNQDSAVDILDVVAMVQYILGGDPTVRSEKPKWWWDKIRRKKGLPFQDYTY
jgi:hypothetical protein